MTHIDYKTFLMATVLILGAFSLSACETVEGAGQDIENAGQAVQKAAN